MDVSEDAGERAIAKWRDDYLAGQITAEQFERRINRVFRRELQKSDIWADRVEELLHRIYQFGLTDEAADEMEAVVKARHEG